MPTTHDKRLNLSNPLNAPHSPPLFITLPTAINYAECVLLIYGNAFT